MKDDTLNTPEINSTIGIGNNNIVDPAAPQLDKKLCFECQTVKSLKTKVRGLERVILRKNKELREYLKQYDTEIRHRAEGLTSEELSKIKQAMIEIQKRDNVTLQSSKDDRD